MNSEKIAHMSDITNQADAISSRNGQPWAQDEITRTYTVVIIIEKLKLLKLILNIFPPQQWRFYHMAICAMSPSGSETENDTNHETLILLNDTLSSEISE